MAPQAVLAPRRFSSVLLYGLIPVGAWFLIRPLLNPLPPLPAFHAAVGFAIFAFLFTIHLVPALSEKFIKARLSGRDLLKTYDDPMYVARVLRQREDVLMSRLLQPRESGSCMRVGLHFTAHPLHPIRVLGCVRR